MTLGKARRYKTARIIDEAWEVPRGFSIGESVSVSFLRKTWGAFIFECHSTSGQCAVISEFLLDNFSSK